MKLLDLLMIIDENNEVRVFKDGNVFVYDGKNSIPEELNGEIIARVYSCSNYIGIDLF